MRRATKSGGLRSMTAVFGRDLQDPSVRGRVNSNCGTGVDRWGICCPRFSSSRTNAVNSAGPVRQLSSPTACENVVAR
jgi:hypothetical protein